MLLTFLDRPQRGLNRDQMMEAAKNRAALESAGMIFVAENGEGAGAYSH